MRRLYTYTEQHKIPIQTFFCSLSPKLQEKLYRQIAMLLRFPGEMHEPQVKHFKMHRYRQLYELREKHQSALIRIIFTLDAEDNIVLLEPFVKNHRRKTNAALESALVKMRRIELDPAHFLSEISATEISQHLGLK